MTKPGTERGADDATGAERAMVAPLARLFTACQHTLAWEGQAVTFPAQRDWTHASGGLRAGRAWVIVSEAGGGARSVTASLVLDLIGLIHGGSNAPSPPPVSVAWIAQASPEQRVTSELLASLAGVSTRDLARMRFTAGDWESLTKATQHLAQAPLRIEHTLTGQPRVVVWDVAPDRVGSILGAGLAQDAGHLLRVELESVADRAMLRRGDVRTLDLEAAAWACVDWVVSVTPGRKRRGSACLRSFHVAWTRPWIGQGDGMLVELADVECSSDGAWAK